MMLAYFAFFVAGFFAAIGLCVLICMMIAHCDTPQRELDWYDM